MSDTTESLPMLMSGYRALDLTDEKGLLCGQIFGGMGVDVIKIEKPGGDEARNIPPFFADTPHPEKSLHWMCCNRNKRGITLNIETADGREILRKLVKSADFLFESFDPGYMENLGLGYHALEEINPGIIMTSVTPFGQTGPYSKFRYADLTLSAMGSVMPACGDGDRSPVRIPFQTAFYGGLHAAMGSMVAHHHRELSGEGQHVDVSMQQAGILTLMIEVEIQNLYGIVSPRMGQHFEYPRPTGNYLIRTIYPCKDGWVHIQYSGGPAGIIKSSNELLRMAAKAGMAGEYANYDFNDYDGQSITQEERVALEDAVTGFLKTKTKKELMDLALEKELIMGPLFNIEEIWESPHYSAREYWEEVYHPELGTAITYPGAAVNISNAPWRTVRQAPLIGEHNHDIYADELGLSSEQLALMKSRGII